MTPDRAAAEEASTYPEHSHEEYLLAWVHQGDGFNYFQCSMCKWIKPDPKCPAWTLALREGARQLYPYLHHTAKCRIKTCTCGLLNLITDSEDGDGKHE